MFASRILRVAFVGLCTSLLIVLMLSVATKPHAFAAGAVSETTTEHGATDTFTDVVPCGAEGPYDITITYNEVEHSTIGPKSMHFTFTQTGTFVAVPQDPSLPTYTGHFTMWGGFNENAKTASGTFTFSLHGTGSDGSTIAFNGVEHFNVTPDGVENEFSFENCH
jgi:hypothetical protein